MKAKVDFVGQQSIFTNDDEVTAEVFIKRCHDEPYFSTLVDSVKLQLVCEGSYHIDDTSSTVVYYESDPVMAKCNYTTRGHVTYSAQLQFPSSKEGLPSSLTYDGRRLNSVRWFVRATVSRNDSPEKQYFHRSCMFRPTTQLDPMLDLLDIEHSEIVDGSRVQLFTTHAAAGLPQVPLAAGIGLSIDVQKPNKFLVKRLRVLLYERNTVYLGKSHKELPLRRWLLEDKHPRSGLTKLDQYTTNLDRWVRDIHLDHATLAPSFETEELHHEFDLVVEVTLSYTDSDNDNIAIKKLTSVSPVRVMPRIHGSYYLKGVASTSRSTHNASEPPTAHHMLFDPAEITDTTDDELDSTDFAAGIYSSDRRDSTASSDSLNSVLSDHYSSKYEEDRLNKSVSPIITMAPVLEEI